MIAFFRLVDSASPYILNPDERKARHVIRRYISGDVVFLNVGAHIGKYAIPVAKTGAKVIAIEPHPLNFLFFRANIMLNNVQDHVIALNQAIWSQEGWYELHLAKKGGQHSLVRSDSPLGKASSSIAPR